MRLAPIAWRGLIARPLRTALAMTGIALGVAVMTATLVTAAASDGAVRSAAADLLGRSDLRLRAFDDAGFSAATLSAIGELDDVVAVAPVSERRLIASTAPGAGERVFSLLVLGIDPAADAAVRDLSLVDGLAISPDSPTDALVPEAWAARNGLGLGDTILLSGRRTGMPGLRISGLVAPTGFGALEGGNVLVMNRSALDDAFEVPAPIRSLDIDLGDEPSPAVVDAVAASMTEPFVVETAADAAARLAPARDGFVGVSLLFGLVSLVVGAFLVGSTLAMTVGERMRELGLLRAAGTTSRQVLGVVALQSLVLGVSGSALGVIGGIGLATGLMGLAALSPAILVGGLTLPYAGLAAAFLTGLLVTLVGAIMPAARAARISPLEALRPMSRAGRGVTDRLRPLVVAELAVVLAAIALVVVTGTDTPLLPIGLGVALLIGGAVAAAYVLEPLARVIGRPFEWFFGAQGLLGRVNLSRDRVRTGLSVGAMMIALAAAIALGTVAESAHAAADARLASILPGGHAIRTGLPLDADTYRGSFEATSGVSIVSPILEQPVVRLTADGQEEAVVAGIDPGVYGDAGALIITGADRESAFAALRDGGAALVPESLATRAGIAVGDEIELGTPGGASHRLVVAGLVAHSLPARTADGAILVAGADARELFGATSATLWILLPQAGLSDSAFAASVRETAAQLAAEPVVARDLAGDLARTLDSLGGLVQVLALVAVIVGALGIVNTLGIGVAERVREIAILRSHGMTVGQVQAMVVAEAAIMGAIAGVLAIVTGLLVAVALVDGGASAELSAGVQPPWLLLVAVLLAGTGTAALAGLYPARVAATLPIVANLKHFE